MKAEERHRLHENELHRLAEHARERSRPFFDRYGTTLLLALAAVLVVIAAVVWWVRSSNVERGEGWDALAAAFRKPSPTAQDFLDVADAFPDSKAAVWARLHAGEAYLGSGIQSLFSDKEAALQDLSDAREAFETVLGMPDVGSEVRVRALYGLARTLETTSDGDLGPAIDRYEQVVQEYPGTLYEGLAQERIDALESPDAKAFYAWFSEAKPVVRDPLARPDDGTAPAMPLPGGSGPAFPGLGGTPAGDAVEAAPIEAPKPAAATGEAAAETPATEAAPSETPAAEGETPAEGPALDGAP